MILKFSLEKYIFTWYNNTQRGDVMLKILSGEKFSIADSSESIRFFAYRSVVFIAADGKPTFDGNPIKSGDGFYLRAGMRVSIGGNGICYKL